MRKGNKKGFLLVEALISIFILIMVATTGISLVIYGYRAINFNRHSLEASWLAQECANAFRGLRDTNWLRFSFDKENCWNMKNETCAPENRIGQRYYIIDTSPATQPTLISIPGALDLSDGVNGDDESYLLYYNDIDPSTDSDSDGNATNDHDYVTYGGGLEESKFFRTIELYGATNERVEGRCLVQWLEGSQVEQISLPVTLTNYLLEP